jgi:20S proteasome subunit alpha 6
MAHPFFLSLSSSLPAYFADIKSFFFLFQRNAEELSSYQKKLIGIDSHLGVALAGLASDARVLSNFMKQQALASRMAYGRPVPLARLVGQLGERAQTNTQHYGRRPYGVGLLVAGIDGGDGSSSSLSSAAKAAGDDNNSSGGGEPRLFEFQPSGLTQEMRACAIGARSQMARTYLERHLDAFAGAGRAELVRHGLRALKESLAQDKELTVENTSVAVMGAATRECPRGEPFRMYDGPAVAALLEGLSSSSSSSLGAETAAPAADESAQQQQQQDQPPPTDPEAMDVDT